MGTPFFCYRFCNSGQAKRPKMKGQSKLTKINVILLQKGPRNAKMQGMPKFLMIWIPPSYMFTCYRFFNSRSLNRLKIKGGRKLTKRKVILLSKGLETAVEICQNVGDTQMPSDLGSPFLSVCLLSFLLFRVAKSTED